MPLTGIPIEIRLVKEELVHERVQTNLSTGRAFFQRLVRLLANPEGSVYSLVRLDYSRFEQGHSFVGKVPLAHIPLNPE